MRGDPMGETAARFPPWPGGDVQEDHSEGPPGVFSFPSFFLSHKKKDGRRRQLDEIISRNDLWHCPQAGPLLPVQNLPISLAVWKAAEVAAVMFLGLRQSPI